MAKPETALAQKIVSWLNAIPGCMARKRHGTPFGVTGDPDIYGCIQGRHFEIEVKVGANVPTKNQEARIGQWSRVGATVGVAYSIDDAKVIMRPLLSELGLGEHCESRRPVRLSAR